MLFKIFNALKNGVYEVTGVAEKRRQEAWAQQVREKRDGIKAQMKPDDGQMGYVVDGVGGDHLVIPVNLQRLKKVMSAGKITDAMNYGDQRGGIDPRNFKVVARSITNNNGMCPMIELKIVDGEIVLHEGNHRLRALETKSLTDTLVVVSAHHNKGMSLDEVAKKIHEACGSENAAVGRVKSSGDGFVYAYIDYEGQHLIPSHYEVGIQKKQYFTVGDPVSKPS